MAKNRIPISNKALSIGLQDLFIQQHFPQFKFSWHNGIGVWIGTLQPRKIAGVYTIMIKYKMKMVPKIWIINPELKANAPHRYRDGSLCLFWPKEWDWSSDQKLSSTLIPWAALWLHYYELWLDTGEWLVESISHSPGEVNKS